MSMISRLKAVAILAFSRTHKPYETEELVRRLYAKDWEENDHPRGKGGKFVKKGSGSVGKSEESEKKSEKMTELKPEKKPTDYADLMSRNKSNAPKLTEKPQTMAKNPIDKSEKTGNNGSATATGASFKKTSPKKFLKTFHAAKAEVAKLWPDKAWRVDSSYTEKDYEDMECFTTPGGSTVAVHDGDIVSVCRNPNDKTARGSDLLKYAREQGGNKLDAFGGLYGFYIQNGFEPVSWCPFADKKDIRPPDWVRGRDRKEPVIFFKYTGKSYEEISKQYGKRKEQFVRRVKKSDDYFAAQRTRDESMKE